MAKGKRAVALFEVIQSAKSKGTPEPVAASPISRPWWKFWQKPSFQRSADPTSDHDLTTTHSIVRPPVTIDTQPSPAAPVVPAMTHTRPPESVETPSPRIDLAPSAEVFIAPKPEPLPPAPRVVSYAQHVDTAHEEDTLDEPVVATVPPVDVKLDRDRKWITFRMNYTSAAVVGFAVLVLIGLAFIVGQHSGQGIAADDPFRAAPLRADVLEVNSGSTVAADTSRPRDVVPVAPPPVEQPRPQASAEQPRPQPQLAHGRVVGLNYVVVQSFADSTLADQAAQMLRQAGVDVTIERGLTGYAGASWYCVVGTRGFEASQGESFAEYTRYVSAIREVGRQFAAKTRGKEFEPQRYRWRDVR